jgi:amino-acid N-acetyltransferase
MDTVIRPATESDVGGILTVVNDCAAQNLMLPRTEVQIHRVLPRFLVATYNGQVVGCGSYVELTPQLTELRSLAVAPKFRHTGLGRRLVEALVARARDDGYDQICALTLVESFFTRLGFTIVDRWAISPKIWHECVYCPKFYACDETAVLMNLTEPEAVSQQPEFSLPLWRRLRVGNLAHW